MFPEIGKLVTGRYPHQERSLQQKVQRAGPVVVVELSLNLLARRSLGAVRRGGDGCGLLLCDVDARDGDTREGDQGQLVEAVEAA